MTAGTTPAEILTFWREAGPDKWFEPEHAFDLSIRSRFFAAYEAAAGGRLAAWQESREGALALVLLLDQFPRNMFRGDARAFATDAMACAVADGALPGLRPRRSPCGRRVLRARRHRRRQHRHAHDVYLEGGDHIPLIHLDQGQFARLNVEARHGRFSAHD
jgi:Bacterial protein of unknown function (DUF924)